MSTSPHPVVHRHASDPLDRIRGLKAEDGKDNWLYAGSKLASALAGEIDELIRKINPAILGSGMPPFDGRPAALSAQLLEHKVYPNGLVLTRYRASR
nr:dihydrofolate reductase family protein [uncultured Paludibaculum sp.]